MEDSPTPASMDFSLLEEYVSSCYCDFMWVIKLINDKFPLGENKRWEYNDETDCVEKISLPEMSWERFEEPNDELS